MEQQYTTKDIADMLGIEAVTVRKYALALEKAGYSVERDAGDRRTYSERDAMAFKQLKALRERSGMSVENSAIAVASKHREASGSVSLTVSEPNQPDVQRYMEQYAADMSAQMKSFMEQFQEQTAATIETKLLEDRGRRLEDHFARTKVKQQLHKEALTAWQEKPKAERLRKAGWFSKEEDTTARDLFILDYVNERYEARLQNEYGIQN